MKNLSRIKGFYIIIYCVSLLSAYFYQQYTGISAHIAIHICKIFFCFIYNSPDDLWLVHTQKASEDQDGRITVDPDSEKHTYSCRFLAIATGHHGKPCYPEIKGLDTFEGDIT